jgi:hypothetical protein
VECEALYHDNAVNDTEKNYTVIIQGFTPIWTSEPILYLIDVFHIKQMTLSSKFVPRSLLL